METCRPQPIPKRSISNLEDLLDVLVPAATLDTEEITIEYNAFEDKLKITAKDKRIFSRLKTYIKRLLGKYDTEIGLTRAFPQGIAFTVYDPLEIKQGDTIVLVRIVGKIGDTTLYLNIPIKANEKEAKIVQKFRELPMVNVEGIIPKNVEHILAYVTHFLAYYNIKVKPQESKVYVINFGKKIQAKEYVITQFSENLVKLREGSLLGSIPYSDGEIYLI